MKTANSNPKQIKKRQRSVRAETSHGEPIDKTKSYTAHQLMKVLCVHRVTMYRWMKHLGLANFVTQIGGSWQITGEQYHAWLDWRREQSHGS